MVLTYPFPHTLIENALSTQQYKELEEGWDSAILTISKNPQKENRVPTPEFSWKQNLAGHLQEMFGVKGAPTRGRYMLRRKGYELHPHIDPPNLLLTVIHYLPKEGQDNNLGTWLYETNFNLVNKTSGAAYYPQGKCLSCVKVFYKPNLVLAFLNTPYSAHGLEKLPEDRLAYQWHIAEEGYHGTNS